MHNLCAIEKTAESHSKLLVRIVIFIFFRLHDIVNRSSSFVISRIVLIPAAIGHPTIEHQRVLVPACQVGRIWTSTVGIKTETTSSARSHAIVIDPAAIVDLSKPASNRDPILDRPIDVALLLGSLNLGEHKVFHQVDRASSLQVQTAIGFRILGVIKR